MGFTGRLRIMGKVMNDRPTTTVLFVVRHGETEWNLIERQQGHLDSPLTERGVQQAHALAKGLADHGIDVLYSSDLGRAFQTATIMADSLGLTIHKDQRLRERHLGTMQGLTRSEHADRYPDDAAAFSTGDPDFVIPGGESIRQQYERCIRCAEELALRLTGQRVLVVAHGGVLRSFFRRAFMLPLSEPRRFSLLNASINSFLIDKGQWRLDSWGETAHLQGITALDDN